MPAVELIYDPDCPNVDGAREQLGRAFVKVGLEPDWQEWNREASGSPGYVRDYGSPTILGEGRDVAGASPSDAKSCRVYSDESGKLQGVPSLEMICQKLAEENGATATTAKKGWRSIWGIVPFIGAALDSGPDLPGLLAGLRRAS